MEGMQKITSARMRLLCRKSRKQRNLLLGIVAVAGTGYGLFRVYRSPSIARKRHQLLRFLTSLVTITEATAASAETVKLVSNDLKSFLQSDSDEIPATIKQLLKAARSPEFCQTLTGICSSVTSGVLQGLKSPDSERNPDSTGVVERLMEKLSTPAGTGFVSVVVGSFARNLVLAFFDNSVNRGAGNEPSGSEGSNPRPPGGVSGFVDVICSGKGRALVGDCIQQFVSTAVSVYLDKTMHINTYDEICDALVNPARHAQMKSFLISVCNGAVETLVRTSHEVLINGSSSSRKGGLIQIKPESQSPNEGQVNSENLNEKDQIVVPDLWTFRPSSSQNMQLSNGINREKITVETHSLDSGFSYHNWIDKISYTLAIPSNRRLFIEMSGKMTFEAVRSFFEFLLCKVSEFFTRTVPEVSHEAVDKVLNIMRYVGAKTIVIATVCLAICLHVLSGVRFLEVMQ